MSTFEYKGRDVSVEPGETIVKTLPKVGKAFSAIGLPLPAKYEVLFAGYPLPQDDDEIIIGNWTYVITDS